MLKSEAKLMRHLNSIAEEKKIELKGQSDMPFMFLQQAVCTIFSHRLSLFGGCRSRIVFLPTLAYLLSVAKIVKQLLYIINLIIVV